MLRTIGIFSLMATALTSTPRHRFASDAHVSHTPFVVTQQSETKSNKVTIRLVETLPQLRAAAAVSLRQQTGPTIDATADRITPDVLAAAINALKALEAKKAAAPSSEVVIFISSDLPSQGLSSAERERLAGIIALLRRAPRAEIETELPYKGR